MFSHQVEYSATVREDIVMGGFVLQVSATDADEGENAKITYSLGNDTDGLFQVDSVSGNITTNGYVSASLACCSICQKKYRHF